MHPAFIVLFYLRLFTLFEALPAIDGLVAARLEGNFGVFSALSTDRCEHLAGTPVHTTATAATRALGSASLTTGLATLGFVSVTSGCKELLLFNREGESLAAVRTYQ
jgi:hypothetical protein